MLNFAQTTNSIPEANREEIRKQKAREYARLWRLNNPDRHLANSRRSYEKNREKCKERCRQYYQSHKEQWKEYRRSWNETDIAKDIKRKWNMENREKINARNRERRQEDPAKFRKWEARYRAKRRLNKVVSAYVNEAEVKPFDDNLIELVNDVLTHGPVWKNYR